MTQATMYQVDYPATPPSLNAFFRYHWAKQRKIKRAWQDDLAVLLMAAGVPRPIGGFVTVSASLRFPKAARRDTVNFQATLDKFCGDMLQAGGWIADDTPEHYHFAGLVFEPDHGPRRTVLMFEVRPASH